MEGVGCQDFEWMISDKVFSNLSHIEDIILGECKGASGMSLDGLDEVDDKAGKGQAAGVYGTCF